MKKDIYKSIIWFGLVAVFIFTPIARGTVKIWAIIPVQIVIFSLVFFWLWKKNNKTQIQKADCADNQRKTVLDILIWLFVALAGVSCIFSIYKYESAMAILRLLSIAGVFYLVRDTFDKNMVNRFVILIISIGTVLSLFGLGQYFLGLAHSWWIPNEFIASTYVNHNHFSGYLELVIPPIIGLLLAYRSWPIQEGYKKIFRILLISAFVLVVLAFVFAQSRGAWVCLTISLIVMAVILVKKRFLSKKRLFIFLFFILLGAVYIYAGHDALTTRFKTFEDIKSENFIDGRKLIWEGSIDMIKDNPVVGIGIGTFLWGFPKYQGPGLNVRVRFAHNEYLHMMAEMGVIALFLMLIIIFTVIKTGIRKVYPKFDKSNSSKRRFTVSDGIYLGSSIGVLSLALHGLVDFNFHILANMLVVSLLAGIIMQISKEENIC